MPQNHNNRELAFRSKLPSLIVRNICCGCFTGHWKSTLPVNRLIYIFDSGTEPSRIGSPAEWCNLTPGKWMLIPAFFEVEHDQHEGLNLVSIHFNLQLCSQIELLGECGKIFQGTAPELRTDFASLVNGTGFSEVFQLNSLVWNFLNKAEPLSPASLEKQGICFSKFTPLLKAFEETPHANFSVENMAKIMKMGKVSFMKHFTSETGLPPHRFFNRLLATAAARELADPRTTVREVAARFGFANEFYFSRFFRRHFNTSPSEYRRDFKHLM